MQPATKICPNCHAPALLDAPQCASCGQVFGAQFLPPPAAYYRGAIRAEPASGLAIASMVLGIVGLVSCCLWWFSIPCSILAVVFGIMSMRGPGKGMGIAGLVCGMVALGVYIVALVFFGSMAALGSSAGLSRDLNTTGGVPYYSSPTGTKK